MKSASIFVAGIIAVLFSSWRTTPGPNYHQADESDLVQADVALGVMKQLDAGHIA
jgi:hypothetical protein